MIELKLKQGLQEGDIDMFHFFWNTNRDISNVFWNVNSHTYLIIVVPGKLQEVQKRLSSLDGIEEFSVICLYTVK